MAILYGQPYPRKKLHLCPRSRSACAYGHPPLKSSILAWNWSQPWRLCFVWKTTVWPWLAHLTFVPCWSSAISKWWKYSSLCNYCLITLLATSSAASLSQNQRGPRCMDFEGWDQRASLFRHQLNHVKGADTAMAARCEATRWRRSVIPADTPLATLLKFF